MAIRDLITDSIIIMLIVEMISGSGYGLHDAEIILLEKLPLEQRVQLESKILNFLGLTSPPQPDLDTLRKSRPAYKYMLALYQSFLDQKVLNISDDVFKRRLALADTVMSFVDHAPPIHFLPQWNSTVRIHFDLNGLQSTDLLLGANLRLFINAKYYSSRTAFFDIHVFQDSNLSAQIFSEATVMRVSKNFVGWLDVDVTKEVEYWRNTFPVNSGFLLKVSDSTGILVQPFCIHLAGQTEKSKKKKAFLVVITKSLRQKDNIAAGRNKRSNGYISQKQSRIEETLAYSTHQSYGSRKLSRCQRRTLYISFRDFGWQKWLIAPEGYYAHFCGGDCSFPLHTHMNATNHAIIQSLIHLMKPSNVPKPCCAPTKLNSLPVLYHYKSPNVILKRYRNMIVKACGCH